MNEEPTGVPEEMVDEAAPAEATPSLMFVVGDVPVPPLELHKFDPAYPEGYYIQGRVPGSEAKVRSGARTMRLEAAKVAGGGNRAQRRGRAATEMTQVMDWDEDAFFLNKCREQITEFRLIGKNPQTGAQQTVVFNPANNEALYRHWLHPRSRNFRDLLEDYLDWIAGRDDSGELDAQFEILGNA